MKTMQMPTDDMPNLDFLDWYDDFTTALDSIDVEELIVVSSLAELGLHLSLHGFSREEDFTEMKIWQGLFMWMANTLLAEEQIQIALNSMYGRKLEGSSKQKELAERYRTLWAKSLVVENFITSDTNVGEFCRMKQEDRDYVLEALERAKYITGRFTSLVDRFHFHILKCSVPEDDIPEE